MDRATYRVVVEYDGTEFCGFQFQPAERTIAGELERALSFLFDEPVKVTCAGRTDAGVHASGQVVSFRAHARFPIERLALALNAALPDDVSARDAAVAGDAFSARFDAIERRYAYRILNRAARSGRHGRFAHHEHRALDDDRMRTAASHLIGSHDFVTFCGSLPQRGDTVRELRGIDIVRSGERVEIAIRGRSFLHHMVRVIVGTLLDVGAGKREPGDVVAMLEGRDRTLAGPTVPAHGLTLVEVRYDGWSSVSRRPCD